MSPPNICLFLNRTFNCYIFIALLIISNLYLYFGQRKVNSSASSENPCSNSATGSFYNEQNILNLFLKNLKQTGDKMM